MEGTYTQQTIQNDVKSYILRNKRHGSNTSISGVFKHIRSLGRYGLVGDMIIASQAVREVSKTRTITDNMLLTLKKASEEARNMTGREWAKWRSWIISETSTPVKIGSQPISQTPKIPQIRHQKN
jgi:hypothetical protein